MRRSASQDNTFITAEVLLNSFFGFAFIYKYKPQERDINTNEMATHPMMVFRDRVKLNIFIKRRIRVIKC